MGGLRFFSWLFFCVALFRPHAVGYLSPALRRCPTPEDRVSPAVEPIPSIARYPLHSRSRPLRRRCPLSSPSPPPRVPPTRFRARRSAFLSSPALGPATPPLPSPDFSMTTVSFCPLNECPSPLSRYPVIPLSRNTLYHPWMSPFLLHLENPPISDHMLSPRFLLTHIAGAHL